MPTEHDGAYIGSAYTESAYTDHRSAGGPTLTAAAPAAPAGAPSPDGARPPHEKLIDMAAAMVVSRALWAAAELGVADHLADGPRTADEVAPLVGAHAPSLYRLLRTLAAAGLFAEGAGGRFALTPLGAALRTGAPGAARASVRDFAGPAMWGSFDEILHCVRTGRTGMERAFGRPLFDYLAERPDEAAAFGETMLGYHGAEPPAVVEAYDFAGVETLVDVGGGIGTLVAAVLRAHPAMRGVLVERPQVAAEARPRLAAAGVAERCAVVEGDFFDAVPPGGDAYVLSHVIHDWDEGDCAVILGNCRRAMAGRGRLLLVEAVIPPGDAPHPAKVLDMVMLAVTGGRERTEAEYAALLAASGFTLTRVVPTRSQASVIEAVPA